MEQCSTPGGEIKVRESFGEGCGGGFSCSAYVRSRPSVALPFMVTNGLREENGGEGGSGGGSGSL